MLVTLRITGTTSGDGIAESGVEESSRLPHWSQLDYIYIYTYNIPPTTILLGICGVTSHIPQRTIDFYYTYTLYKCVYIYTIKLIWVVHVPQIFYRVWPPWPQAYLITLSQGSSSEAFQSDKSASSMEVVLRVVVDVLSSGKSDGILQLQVYRHSFKLVESKHGMISKFQKPQRTI